MSLTDLPVVNPIPAFGGTQGSAADERLAGSDAQALSATQDVLPVFVHPGAKSMFAKVPCFRTVPIIGSAVEAFGPKCVFSLGAVYILSKGIARSVLRYSLFPMFMKKFKVTPETYQRMSGISSMGFSIKPITAIFSDSVAVFKYRKRWYMLISSTVGALCAVIYGILPERQSSAPLAAGMLFVTMFCIANVDVMSEGHYSRLIKRFPMPGANLISSIWALIMVGSVVASAIQGPVSDLGIPRVGVFVSAASQALCGVFFILNWYGEIPNREERMNDHALFLAETASLSSSVDRVVSMVGTKPAPPLLSDNLPLDAPEVKLSATNASADAHGAAVDGDTTLVDLTEGHFAMQNPMLKTAVVDADIVDEVTATYTRLHSECCRGIVEVNTDVLARNTSVAIYAVLMTAAVVAIALLNILGNTYQLLYGCVILSFVLCATGFIFLPCTIMKANFFGWVQLALYIAIPGALDNFYMADSMCVPNGPGFNQTFYNTVGALIGNCAGLVGVYCFASLFSKRTYRLTFIVTIAVQVIASVFDLVIVRRWNIAIGIPDHAMYIMGDAVVYQVSYMLSYMPMNILISRLCPKGCESTMFAILASCSNLGESMANTIGTILMETIWPVNMNVKPCDFSNLPWMIIAGHMVAPLCCLPLVFYFIPKNRICDEIDPKLLDEVPFILQWKRAFAKWRRERAELSCAKTHLTASQGMSNEPL